MCSEGATGWRPFWKETPILSFLPLYRRAPGVNTGCGVSGPQRAVETLRPREVRSCQGYPASPQQSWESPEATLPRAAFGVGDHLLSAYWCLLPALMMKHTNSHSEGSDRAWTWQGSQEAFLEEAGWGSLQMCEAVQSRKRVSQAEYTKCACLARVCAP